ncbi:M20 family metallopeptidase [Anaerolentibacter hominis]|uniref:M20 metallopeptidase family protein n=1 Tax=Anaerolentibacter hominis TaxID=3079009 RepID=UPI0031B825ED
MGTQMNDIKQSALNMREQLIKDRRYFHKNPELSREERQTSEYIRSSLNVEGIPWTQVCETGVKGLIRGSAPGKTILLRADMDALPVQEASSFRFASCRPGVMHACGHDAHMSMLLGAGRILNHRKDRLHGNVVLCFQPAEEGKGGGRQIVQEGILKHPSVDYAVALHVDPTHKAGCITLEDGPVTANPDFFTITVTGQGGHGAFPEKSRDPLLPAVKIYERIRALHSVAPAGEKAVVQLCSIRGGSAPAVIPDSVIIQGTVRTQTSAARTLIWDGIDRILLEADAAYPVSFALEYWSGGFAVYNNPLYSELARRSIRRDFTFTTAGDLKMIGDDFCYFSEQVPASYLFLGCAPEGSAPYFSLHSPAFALEEDILPMGAYALAKIALDFLSDPSYKKKG